MECELLIPVKPATNYDKLLMFKRAKALHPEIPDLEAANDISDLLSVDRLGQTLREYNFVDSVSATESAATSCAKAPSLKVPGPSTAVADFGQSAFSKVKVKLEALEAVGEAKKLPDPKKIPPPKTIKVEAPTPTSSRGYSPPNPPKVMKAKNPKKGRLQVPLLPSPKLKEKGEVASSPTTRAQAKKKTSFFQNQGERSTPGAGQEARRRKSPKGI